MQHTEREEQVCQLLLQGLTNSEIAARMGVKTRTVKSHLKHLFLKHGIDDASKIKRILLAVKLYEERRR